MALLSKVKKTLGVVKNKASSALAGITKGAKSGMANKVISTGSKALKLAKVAPVVGGVVTAVKIASKVPGTAPNLYSRAIKKITGKSVISPTVPVTSKKIPRAVKVAGAVVGAGLALVGAEKIAEKIGIRGGAGFIGARPRRKRRSKYLTIRVPRNRRGRGKITKAEERRLRNTARSYSYSDGTSRRSRRKKGKRGSKSYMAWVRSFRRKN